MKHVLFLALLLCLHAGARAAAPCPPSKGTAEWSARCLEGQGEQRRVKARYLQRLDWNGHGKATILVAETFELLAVDRTGRVVVPGIWHAGDFDYPYADHGIARFSVRAGARASHCGYFDQQRFAVVVPAKYDQCLAYHDGVALACQGCRQYCTDADCHDSKLVGGQGFVLDTRGNVTRSYALPSLAQACGGRGGTVSGSDAVAVLRCEPAGPPPFQP